VIEGEQRIEFLEAPVLISANFLTDQMKPLVKILMYGIFSSLLLSAGVASFE
jgi:hypothetical protein